MGFSQAQARTALRHTTSVQEAIEWLLAQNENGSNSVTRSSSAVADEDFVVISSTKSDLPAPAPIPMYKPIIPDLIMFDEKTGRQLSVGSQLLDPDLRLDLDAALPEKHRGYDWKLLYSMLLHGASVSTFYARTAKADQTIVAVETEMGEVFGGFASQEWRRKCPNYYGTGESFLWSAQPRFRMFQWTGVNDYIMHSGPDCIAFGGGGSFGLYIGGGDFAKGSSSHSSTFDNPGLSSGELFSCVNLEVWGFSPKRACVNTYT